MDLGALMLNIFREPHDAGAFNPSAIQKIWIDFLAGRERYRVAKLFPFRFGYR